MNVNPNDVPPEEIDRHMDLVDLVMNNSADDVLERLPVIKGVSYRRPRTWEQIMREDFGDGQDPVVLPR